MMMHSESSVYVPMLHSVWQMSEPELDVTMTFESVAAARAVFDSLRTTYLTLMAHPFKKEWNTLLGWKNWDKPRKKQRIKAEQMQYKTIKMSV